MNNIDINLLGDRRNSRIPGLDILRIIAMFMIVFLHVSGHGGIPNQLRISDPLSVNYYISTFFHYFANIGVNIFVILTGYLYADRKWKITNLLNIIYAVIFYSIIFWIFQRRLSQNPVGIKILLQNLSGYWFVNVYLALFCFIPFLNILIKQKKEAFLGILTGLLLFSIVPTFTRLDMYGANGGFSVLWFFILYSAGAYGRIYNLADKFNYWKIYLLCFLFAIGCKLITEELLFLIRGKYSIAGGWFFPYNSPTNFLQAFCFVMIFSKIKEVPNVIVKIATWGSPLMLGIYLIHDSCFVRTEFILNKFCTYGLSSPWIYVGKLIGTVFVVFIFCLIIEYLRSFIFSILQIKRLNGFIETYLNKWMNYWHK